MDEGIKKTAMSYDGEEIDVSDIPEITDFSRAVKNPYAGKFIRDGKFWVRVHFNDRVEMQEVEAATKTILSTKVIEYKTDNPAQPENASDYPSWRSRLQDENISLRELSRRAMEAQAST